MLSRSANAPGSGLHAQRGRKGYFPSGGMDKKMQTTASAKTSDCCTTE